MNFIRNIQGWLGTSVLALLLVGGTAQVANGWQQSSAASATATPAPVPFGEGERAEYQVKLGGLSVGSGSMEILGTETVRGHLTYHAQLRVSGGGIVQDQEFVISRERGHHLPDPPQQHPDRGRLVVSRNAKIDQDSRRISLVSRWRIATP